MGREKPGQTLQPTALVHEAYLRLVDVEHAQQWSSRGHFFAAAAEAMRRILVERARRRARTKHGGRVKRVDVELEHLPGRQTPEHPVALDPAPERLRTHDPLKA